ncbi:fatty acyl-CoA synthetase and RNA processing-associated kinase 1 [Biomphalaria pfeifferi]|uniref:Fatty acyl-CoA synthetase and RNA processing-associated kinase 1 n=1 Tax=Biomphalaria pfeifferi TaxID=112525 RepID=A0AAD8F7F6_BIOPF|nr:fatty acyl-CoA synthetase and RNA processing-associated kinase 1 [Biomphalaria pfeifferi]
MPCAALLWNQVSSRQRVRDLKSDNILLTKQKNVVIADFGLGDYVWLREPLVTGKKGTLMHISPEQGEEPFNCFKCDMYSLGVVYWCMLYRVDVIDLKPKEPLLSLVSQTFHVPDIDRDILSCHLEADPISSPESDQFTELLETF